MFDNSSAQLYGPIVSWINQVARLSQEKPVDPIFLQVDSLFEFTFPSARSADNTKVKEPNLPYYFLLEAEALDPCFFQGC